MPKPTMRTLATARATEPAGNTRRLQPRFNPEWTRSHRARLSTLRTSAPAALRERVLRELRAVVDAVPRR